jgi:hypothetical protein
MFSLDFDLEKVRNNDNENYIKSPYHESENYELQRNKFYDNINIENEATKKESLILKIEEEITKTITNQEKNYKNSKSRRNSLNYVNAKRKNDKKMVENCDENKRNSNNNKEYWGIRIKNKIGCSNILCKRLDNYKINQIRNILKIFKNKKK